MISTNARLSGNLPNSTANGEASKDRLFSGEAATALTQELASPLEGMHTLTRLMEHYLRKKMGGDKFLAVTVQDLAAEISRLKVLIKEFDSLICRKELDLRLLDLAALGGEFLPLREWGWGEKGVRVESIFPADLPRVKADRNKLQEVLDKLCANAVEAMPEGGVLTLRGWADARQVHLAVQDTGMGIPQGLSLFEPFVTTKRSGTGLGLAIVRRIMAAHGGAVRYFSNPGAGTTFTVSLARGVSED
jgi:signal transduction histidine kinase